MQNLHGLLVSEYNGGHMPRAGVGSALGMFAWHTSWSIACATYITWMKSLLGGALYMLVHVLVEVHFFAGIASIYLGVDVHFFRHVFDVLKTLSQIRKAPATAGAFRKNV